MWSSTSRLLTNKIKREGHVNTNWRNKAPEQDTVSTLHKISKDLIVNSLPEDKPTTVSIVDPYLVNHCKAQFSSCTIWTLKLEGT